LKLVWQLREEMGKQKPEVSSLAGGGKSSSYVTATLIWYSIV